MHDMMNSGTEKKEMQPVSVHVVGRRRNWRHFEQSELPITTDLSRRVAAMEAMGQVRMPNLRRGSALRVSSDYAGQDPHLTYRVIAFLVTDDVSLRRWNATREQIRARYLPNNEHLSFKDLRYKTKIRALRPFLSAADAMDGICVAVAVHKRIGSLFFPDGPPDLRAPEAEPFRAWDLRTLENVMRTVHFVSMFIAGLFDPQQPVWWFADDDDMVANSARHRLFAQYWGTILRQQSGGSFNELRFGTPKVNDNPLFMEDMLAIPDLVAGALAETLTDLDLAEQMPTQPPVIAAIPPSRKLKVEPIIEWLADDRRSLCRMLLTINPTRIPGRFQPAWFTLHTGVREGAPPLILPTR